MLATIGVLVAVVAAAPCKTTAPRSGRAASADTSTGAARVYLEAEPVGPRDTAMLVHLCLAGTPTTVAGSASGRVVFDSAFAIVRGVETAPRAGIVARADSTGVRFAGAAVGGGLPHGALLTVRVGLRQRGVIGAAGLTLTELSGPDGRSLLSRTTVDGLDARCVGPAPAIFEVLPPEVRTDPGEPLDLIINGCGFRAAGNVVRIGEATYANIPSTASGTRIHLVAPKEYRSTSEAPPMAMAAGEYEVTVNNHAATSNARRLRLR